MAVSGLTGFQRTLWMANKLGKKRGLQEVKDHMKKVGWKKKEPGVSVSYTLVFRVMVRGDFSTSSRFLANTNSEPKDYMAGYLSLHVYLCVCVFVCVCTVYTDRVMGLGENQQPQQPGGCPRAVRGRASPAEGGKGDVCKGQHCRRQEQLPGDTPPS